MSVLLPKLKMRIIVFISSIFIFYGGVVFADSVTPQNIKTPPVMLKISDILPNTWSGGPSYLVSTDVMNDGFINTYEVNSRYGAMQIESTAKLKIRINEINALDRMEELKKTDVYKNSFMSAAKAPINTAKGLVTEPVDTVKGTVTGIGRWFSNVGKAVVSDDPHQDNVLSAAVGYDASKRKFAYEFGINPYTDFKPVQERLNEIARASIGGSLTVKAAFAAIQDTPGTVVSASSTADSMRKLVRDKSPGELEKINRDKLLQMGVSRSTAEIFLSKPNYDPQETTLLVGALYSMGGVQDRSKFIQKAAQVPDRDVALFVRLQAEMMQAYSFKVAPVARVVNAWDTILLQRKDGVIVGLFPLDHLESTDGLWRKEESVSNYIGQISGVTGKEMLITGTATPEVGKTLAARGWKVNERAENLLYK